MRHKVVEKPTEKKRERVRARAQGCGRGEASRSKSPLSVPYRPRQSTLQSRGWAERIVPLRSRSSAWSTKSGANRQRRRGCYATLGVVVVVIRRTNSISRNASCLVLLKKLAITDTSFSSVKRNIVLGKAFLVFTIEFYG